MRCRCRLGYDILGFLGPRACKSVEILGSVVMWMVWSFDVREVFMVSGSLMCGSLRGCGPYPQSLDFDKF